MTTFELNKFQFIADEKLNGESGEKHRVLNKYTLEMMAQDNLASETQVEKALEAAHLAQEELAELSAEKRRSELEKLYKMLEEHQNDFLNLIINEAGKPISYAKAEVQRSLTTLKLTYEECTRFSGEMVPIDYGVGVGKTAYTKRFPIGPILCITPFNFPLNLLMHKIAPALAIGCAVIVKPPVQSPLCALALAQLIEKLDLPKGCFNVLNCSNENAQKLVEDERLSMLSFTGSAAVGWKLKSLAGKKKVVLELGGNAAALVDDNSDLDGAVASIAKGAYLYAGQICISTQRIFVHENVYDEFQEKLIEEIQNIKSGDPHKDDVWVGPLIDGKHFQRIQEWVDEAIKDGAEALIKGEVLDKNKNILTPTLLTKTNPQMKVVQEEVFGPVAILEKVANFKQGLKAVNDSVYGLQAGVFTNSIEHMKLAHQKLKVGGVIINSAPGFRIDNMPYGGIKDSGLGREGTLYAMNDMSEPRLLVY